MTTSAKQHGLYAGRAFDRDRSLGNREFGKTTVDCCFLRSESKWGTLGENNPAGLLRLALNFHEPANCKLSSAEVNLCFLPAEASADPPLPPPNVTKHLYPQLLGGPPLSRHTSRSNDIEPTVEAMRTSVGGVGIHNTTELSKTFRWFLQGSRLPNEQNSYTKAEWSWEANNPNEQSEIKRAFELALVLLHSGPRIDVMVSIKGRLRHLTQRWRTYIFRQIAKIPHPTYRNTTPANLQKYHTTLGHLAQPGSTSAHPGSAASIC